MNPIQPGHSGERVDLGGPATPLLQVEDLCARYSSPSGQIDAVDGVSFAVQSGERVGILGESGSGKTTLVRSLLGLTPPGARLSGRVLWKSRDLLRMTEAELTQVRGKQIGLIFQEPGVSLNPFARIESQLIEAPRYHFGDNREQLRSQALQLLEETGIDDVDRCLSSYPHQLSGGLQQRVVLAMALMCRPQLVIADEPTSSLDSITGSQVLHVLQRTVSDRELALILISHDWRIIEFLADTVIVMRQGRVVEAGRVQDIRARASAYTRGLIGLEGTT